MDVTELAERYVMLWNEPDRASRRQMVEALWAPSGRHFVGPRTITGYEALEQRVAEAHQRNVVEGGYRFALGPVHAVSDVILLDWTMFPADGGDPVASGRDVLLVDPEMRILSDYQVILA